MSLQIATENFVNISSAPLKKAIPFAMKKWPCKRTGL